jgi:HlyD family secretion protein
VKLKPEYSRHRQQALSFTGIVVIIALIAASWIGYAMLFPSDDTTDENAQYYDVSKGSFLVTIVEGGTLEAVNEISVRNEVKYPTKIVTIVPEGTFVKKGQLLCELDVSDIEDRLDEHKLAVESAEFAVKQAAEDLKITKSQQESFIKAAQLKVEFAKTDKDKYVDGDWPQIKRDAESTILTAKEKLAIDKDSLDWSVKLAKEGFETDKKVETDRYTFLQSEVRLKQVEESLRLLNKYDHPKLLRQFESNLEEAQEDLVRVKSQAASKISQEEAELKTTENRAGLQRKKLGEYEEQIAAAKIHAPEDGMVVYPFVSFRSMSQAMIEEGASVRPRQELIKLPDVSQMKVTIKVHESHVNQVVAGMGAYVVLDSLPDLRFKGHVQRVNLMPDQGSRFSNPNLKVYSTVILVDDKLPDVKPGLSARAEIVVTNLTDVIKVPLQCVTTHKNTQVCYVKKGGEDTPTPVEVGLYNAKFIEVTSGLKPGDQINLSPPLSAEEIGLDKALVEEGGALPPTKKVIPQAKSPEKAGKGGKSRQGKGGQQKGGSRKMSSEMLKRFDKNGNGTIDEDERAAVGEYYRKQRSAKGGS